MYPSRGNPGSTTNTPHVTNIRLIPLFMEGERALMISIFKNGKAKMKENANADVTCGRTSSFVDT